MKILSPVLAAISIIAGLGLIVLVYGSFGIEDPKSINCTNWVCKFFGAKEKIEVIKFLGWIAAGTISLVVAWSAAKRAYALNQTANAHYETSRTQLKIAAIDRFRKGQAHFRETKGVTGAESMLLASLEQGMENYAGEVSMEICEYIRNETSSTYYRKLNHSRPSREISRILEVIFVGKTERQGKNVDTFWKHVKADLSGSYLVGCDLKGANFKKARLDGVYFNSANLKQARFYGASLRESKFVHAKLTGAAFMGADLTVAHFQEAYLPEARFQGSLLKGTEFIEAKLGDAEFMGAQMPSAVFSGASAMPRVLQGWDFSDSWGRLFRIYLRPILYKWYFRGFLKWYFRGLKKWDFDKLRGDRPWNLQRWHFRGTFTESPYHRDDVLNWRERLIFGLDSWGSRRHSPGPQDQYKPRLPNVNFSPEYPATMCPWGEKIDKEWDSMGKKITNYQKKDIKKWEKDYEENKKTQLLSMRTRKRPASITYRHPMQSPPYAAT